MSISFTPPRPPQEGEILTLPARRARVRKQPATSATNDLNFLNGLNIFNFELFWSPTLSSRPPACSVPRHECTATANHRRRQR